MRSKKKKAVARACLLVLCPQQYQQDLHTSQTPTLTIPLTLTAVNVRFFAWAHPWVSHSHSAFVETSKLVKELSGGFRARDREDGPQPSICENVDVVHRHTRTRAYVKKSKEHVFFLQDSPIYQVSLSKAFSLDHFELKEKPRKKQGLSSQLKL